MNESQSSEKVIEYTFPSGQTRTYHVIEESEHTFVTKTLTSYGAEVFEFNKDAIDQNQQYEVIKK